MIPILYEKDETAFASNGLGRLRDCISCIVTEERNGIYECDFEYPIDGVNYDRIQLGRIIAVEHDETNDVQPFDIVSYSRPINRVVTFHAVHISYRQTALTVSGTNINSLADAFTLFGSAEPSNPFSYWTDKDSTGFLASADGIPHTVRQILGGMEGSILDAYGGEYEWDRWTVKLWSSRGSLKSFTIRYGVNLADYTEEVDYTDTYTSVIPYWVGQDASGNDLVVKGDIQSTSYPSFNGQGRCIPLDVTDKFETQPTKAQVEAAGLSYIETNQTYLPAQNITVDFVRISDTPEYAQFKSLQTCKLCDSIKVEFPRYNMTGTFKIVRTEYDVLQERYNKLELGTLSTSLAEALGISQESATRLSDGSISATNISASGNFYLDGDFKIDGSKPILFGEYDSGLSTISAQSVGTVDATIASPPSGYIGYIIRCRVQNGTGGSNESGCNLYNYYFQSSNTVRASVRNNFTSQAKVHVLFTVMWVNSKMVGSA